MTNVVVCCFCGLSLSEREAVLLTIYPTSSRDEAQNLYSHHKCLRVRLRPEVPQHPALEDLR